MKTFESLVGAAARKAMHENHQIKQVISRIVPAATLAHVQFCRVEGGRMRMTVGSAAWIARIRFIDRQIIDELRRQSYDVHTISYHVAPAEQPISRVTVRDPLKATPRAAASIEATAAQLHGKNTEENDSLRLELLKLAKKLRDQ